MSSSSFSPPPRPASPATTAGDSSHPFLSLACQLELLTADQSLELARVSTERQLPPEQAALRMGLLNVTQVDIVETLLRPNDAVPGFEILGLLGRGGMGVVYRARQKSLDRIVALKTVLVSELSDPTTLQRFEQEAVALARFSHPHIVAAYDFGKHQGRLYFAMEFVVGEDCERLIQRHGPVDEATAWGLIRQAASGLAYAAAAGIVHRDIKPANLLLLEPPVGFPLPKGIPLVKIADFGLAILSSETAGDARTRLTMQNMTVGSPHYMAPEQIEDAAIDFRADIYALGATAWHLLTGQPPLAGKTLSQLMSAKLTAELPSVRSLRSTLSPSTEGLVARMVRRQPSERPASYDELLRQLDAMNWTGANVERPSTLLVPAEGPSAMTETLQFARRGSDPTPAPAATIGPTIAVQPARKSARGKLVLVAVTAALASLGSLGGFYWNSVRDRPGERDLVPTHASSWLFDGHSLAQWRSLSGSWHAGENDEQGQVLVGERGMVARSLPKSLRLADGPPLSHYRLDLGVQLNQATAVELHFDLASSSAAASRRVLRMTPAGSQLGTRDGDQSPFVSKAPPHPYPVEAEELHHVRIERQRQGWWVFVDGQQVGAISARQPLTVGEFRLAVEKGPAWFSDCIVEELAAPGKGGSPGATGEASAEPVPSEAPPQTNSRNALASGFSEEPDASAYRLMKLDTATTTFRPQGL